jgi:hypothetical protein
MTLRLRPSLLAVCCAVAACGNTSVSGPPEPRLIAGGGVGDVPVAGGVNVYVIDDDTKKPVSGAAVRVGGSSDPMACAQTTDSTGLAIFTSMTCMLVTSGKQSLTASASGYAPSTWIGVDGANVTIAIRAMTTPPVDTAVVTGTIAGWDALPAPAAGHQTLAIVGASASRTLGDAANDIPQEQRNVMVGVVPFPIASNLCVRNALVSDCNWKLKTRTGPQAHYAIVVDVDSKGNDVEADDTFTVIAWAVKRGLDFTKDHGADGETLTLLTDAEMQSFSATFPTPLTGLSYVAAFPMLDLGDEGRIAIILPALDPQHTMTKVPKLAGPLANAKYDLFANLKDEKDKDQPSSIAWAHGVDPTKTVTSLAWLAPPTALKAEGGVFSFTPVTGASVHGGELLTAAGKRAWSITIFDGTTSFTLPGVSPDPLPAGDARFVASAFVIPGFKPNDVSFQDLQDTLTHLASDFVAFVR